MAQGSITARVFTSDSEIPLHNAAVSIMRRGAEGARELLAFRLTDRNGLTLSLNLTTPPAAESQSSDAGGSPFTLIDMAAQQPGYDSIFTENVQVFAGVETRQDFKLIPTAELPDVYDAASVFTTTVQNL